ncbi:MAG: GPW/gp25 family protein [Sphingomonadaceae bacterium]
MSAHLDLPFGFDGRGRTATTDLEDHVHDMIRLVLFTAPGERVMRPDFGCGVRQLVFAPLSETLAATTQHLVQGALMRHLGDRILIDGVDVAHRDSLLEIAVRYRLVDGGQPQLARFTEAVPQ